jgi:hypothetical protein
MTKTEALKIARHLIGDVHVVAASLQAGKTYGYNYASGEKTYSTHECGSYRAAVIARRRSIEAMTHDLVNGESADWETLAFKW